MNYAYLSPLFFKEFMPDSAFLAKANSQLDEKFKNLNPWSKLCFPIYQWNEMLFIAVAQGYKPDFPIKNTWLFVECETSLLEPIWAQMQESPAQKSTPAAVTQAPPKKMEEDPFASLGVSSPSIDLESLVTENVDDSISKSELLEIDLNATVENPLKPNSPPKPELANQVQSALKDPENSVITEITPAETPGLAVSASLIEKTFRDLQYHFQKSMILIKQDDALTPWKWDQGFESSHGKKTSSVNLKEPSPFRVVSRTHKSYHGHIAASDTMDMFIEEWNQSQNPDNLTLVPLEYEGELFGMFASFGALSSYNASSLHLAEKLAIEFTKAIRQDSKSSAA